METLTTQQALKAVQAELAQNAPTAAQTVMLFGADGTPNGKYPAQQLLQDMAKAGTAYGICSTAATTAAKVVSITDFILLKNGIVSVLFNSAVSVAGATLNVSNTGAKDIYINGSPLQPGVIRPKMVAMMQYDGTRWNIISLSGLEQSDDPSDLYVDLALPSGLKWAKRNIDISQANGFAASEFQYECSFFSWGNTDGHNPTSASSFSPYDWGTNNDGPYASTPGAALTGNMSPSMDAARANLGAPWRMPLTGEFQELFDNCIFIDAEGVEIPAATTNKLITLNSIVGIWLKSKNNAKTIFFPCSGSGYGSSWGSRGSYGYYWSGSLHSATRGRVLVFSSGGVYPQNSDYRFVGFAVRAVQ